MKLRNRIQANRMLNRGRRRQKNDHTGKIDDFMQAIALDPNLATAYYERGDSHGYLANWESAVADFTEAIRLKPNHAAPYFKRAKARLKLHEYQGAMEDLTEFLRFDPYDTEAVFLRGLARGGLEDSTGAIEDFTYVLERLWRPSSLANDHISKIFRLRGVAYHNLGDIDKALHDYGLAIKLGPLDPKPLLYRATVYHDLRQLENALADYIQAIALDPDNHCPFINRGELYFVQTQYNLALADFREALRLKPDFSMARADLAVTLYKLGNISEAQTLWRQLIDTDTHFRDSAWVKTHFRWDDALADEAQKLLDSLQ